MVYQKNEYNWCVMNNIVDNKEFTILFYVNDLKTSHVNPAVVSGVLDDIDAEYGKIEKWPSHGAKYMNTLGWLFITPFLVR